MSNLFEGIALVIVPSLLALALIIAVFMACREIVCWYGKINERLELEKHRNDRLDEIAQSLKILIQIEVAKKEERDDFHLGTAQDSEVSNPE